MNENVSRSTIFRNKMRIEAAKRNEAEVLAQETQRNETNKAIHFATKMGLPKSKEDIEK